MASVLGGELMEKRGERRERREKKKKGFPREGIKKYALLLCCVATVH
jgi:hypothetical protein